MKTSMSLCRLLGDLHLNDKLPHLETNAVMYKLLGRGGVEFLEVHMILQCPKQ